MQPAMPKTSACSWLRASAAGSWVRARAGHRGSSGTRSVAEPGPRLSVAAP